MPHWKLGVYGHHHDDIQEDSMDYYFVVLNDSEVVECVVHRHKGATITPVAGKRFVKADGVRLTFYYRLKEQSEEVTLPQVMSY